MLTEYLLGEHICWLTHEFYNIQTSIIQCSQGTGLLVIVYVPIPLLQLQDPKSRKIQLTARTVLDSSAQPKPQPEQDPPALNKSYFSDWESSGFKWR